MIKWNVTAKEDDTIRKIAMRAAEMMARAGIEFPQEDIMMDLTATHANGTPLDLEGLLHAEDFDFSHDVLGIRMNLNRTTGQLEGFFLPRYARLP